MDVTYQYDDLDRLEFIQAQYRGHTTYGHNYNSFYGYDDNDNIVEKDQWHGEEDYAPTDEGFDSSVLTGSPVTSNSYSLFPTTPAGRHQPSSVMVAPGDPNVLGYTRTMHFDPNGNNTGDTGGPYSRVLTWDDENRLKQVDVGGITRGRYLYSPAGERTQKQDAANGGTTFYVNQYLVIDKNKNVTKHIYAGATRVASKTESIQTATVRSFYHPDHLGSSSYISDASQNLVQHERYFPSGERWADPQLEEIASGINPRDWLFSGKELDRDTGLYYFGARYLDPQLSSWMSPDPILESYMKGTPNGGVLQPKNLGLYTYGWNNPIRLSDPTGMQTYDPSQAMVRVDGGRYEPAEKITFEGEEEVIEGRQPRQNPRSVQRTLDKMTEWQKPVAEQIRRSAGRLKVYHTILEIDAAGAGMIASAVEAAGESAAAGVAGEVAGGTVEGGLEEGATLAPRGTGTVWDHITPTQPVWDETVVPRSFELTAENGTAVWVHGNATEHLAEYATSMLSRGVNSGLVNISSQAQLTSLRAAVSSAIEHGVPLGRLVNVGGWELKFGPPRAPGLLPALIHAMPE